MQQSWGFSCPICICYVNKNSEYVFNNKIRRYEWDLENTWDIEKSIKCLEFWHKLRTSLLIGIATASLSRMPMMAYTTERIYFCKLCCHYKSMVKSRTSLGRILFSTLKLTVGRDRNRILLLFCPEELQTSAAC